MDNKVLKEPISPDEEWANDVPFKNLEKEIEEKKEASSDAFRSLEEATEKEPVLQEAPFEETSSKKADEYPKKTKKSVKKSSKKDNEKAKIPEKSSKKEAKGNKVNNKSVKAGSAKPESIKKSNKKFAIILFSYLAVLALIMGVLLVRFYYFLADYEAVYNESLPYHNMDDFMEIFETNNYEEIASRISEAPEITKFESQENLDNYIEYLLKDKTIEYYEANDSTDRVPKYNVMADGYIVGSVSYRQSSEKRAHDLPIYEFDSFEFYTDPSYSAIIQAPDNCEAYVNDVLVTDEYILRTDVNENSNFKDYATLPNTNYYMVDSLYEKPTVKIINNYGMEFEPTLNHETGIYETAYKVPEELETEMIDFAKYSVDIYARVMSRELGAYALDAVFTKGHPWVNAIKSNDSQFVWFPNHSTTGTDDTIRDFIPYTEDAFYVEIEHVQHTLKYGVYPVDIPLLAQIYYVKEDGNWKICQINFIYDD